MDGADESLPDWLDVSRETFAGMRDHLALVRRWNPTINLVSKGSLDHGWERHVLDSAQLWWIANVQSGTWLDLGSGGGFPGLVIALIAREKAPDLRIVLVESDRRKCAFLADASRQLGLETDVKTCRIDALDEQGAAVVSARALAPLVHLLDHAKRHLTRSGVALFPKGRTFAQEVSDARKTWHFDCAANASQTDPSSVVLRIENIRHV